MSAIGVSEFSNILSAFSCLNASTLMCFFPGLLSYQTHTDQKQGKDLYYLNCIMT